jgi:hypothetical protein
VLSYVPLFAIRKRLLRRGEEAVQFVASIFVKPHNLAGVVDPIGPGYRAGQYLFSASFIVRRMLFGSLSEGSTW